MTSLGFKRLAGVLLATMILGGAAVAPAQSVEPTAGAAPHGLGLVDEYA